MSKNSYNHWTSFLSLLQSENSICERLNKLELKRLQYVSCKAENDEIKKIYDEMKHLQSELEGVRKRISHRIDFTPTGGNAD